MDEEEEVRPDMMFVVDVVVEPLPNTRTPQLSPSSAAAA